MAMAKISKKEIKHVASLARLTLNNKEIIRFGAQLTDIFDFVDKIGEMKTKSVVETSYVTGDFNRFRDDVIDTQRILSQEEALKNAKKTKNGYFLVKSIFDK